MDRNEVDRLVVQHLPVALRFAHRLTGDPHQAEDVVQEALCRVLRCWNSYRAEATFSTWLLKIVLNVDRDRRRQPASSTLPEGIASKTTQHPAEKLLAEEQKTQLRAAIEKLPQRQREVALLCLGEGLSARDAAEVLETTPENIHANVHLARKRIAAAMGIAATEGSSNERA